MIKKLKSFYRQKEKKKVIENIFSLSVLQIGNYILPLVTLPYLVRVLGPEKFGLIAFSQAFIQYFMLLTDFGFNLSATREISINRDNDEKVSKIFTSVFFIKGLLLVFSFIIIFFVVESFSVFKSDKEVFYLTSLSVIGWAMFPQWYFQGVENMKYVTFFNIASKGFFTVCVFVFIKQQSDYVILPLLNSLGLIVSGAISLFISIRYFDIKISWPGYIEIRHQFKEGWHIFVSNISINLYTTSNSVLLGLLTNNTIVGYYSAAERIFKAFQFLGMPVYQAFYPYISKLYIDNINQAILVFNKLFKATILLTLLLSLALTFLSPIIIKLLLGENFEQSIVVFRLLSWVILSSWGNYILGIHGLVNFGYKEVFAKIVLIFGVIHIILLLFFIPLFGLPTVPIVWFITETLIFLTEYKYLTRIKILNGLI